MGTGGLNLELTGVCRWRGVQSHVVLALNASKGCCDAGLCPDPADLRDLMSFPGAAFLFLSPPASV